MKPHHIFLSALVAGLAIALVVEHQTRLKLANEHLALEQEYQKLADLVAQNAQLSIQLAQTRAPKPLSPDQLAELLRLRGRVGTLRRQQSNLDQAREENRQSHAVLARYFKSLSDTNNGAAPGYLTPGQWTNTGYASPEDALQTTLWAGYNGDVTNFFASMTEEAQTNMFNELKGKSAVEASIQLADDTYDLKSLQILSREVLDDDTISLTVAMEGKDDFHIGKVLMKRIAGQWKFAGPPQ